MKIEKKLIHSLIGLLLMFVLGHIVPAPYPITAVGMQVVGVFMGLIWLWCFVGFLWPSLLGLVAFALTDFASMGQVVTSSFGNSVVILLLLSMIIFGSMEHVGATKYITRWFLTRSIFNGRPIIFSLIFMLATYALSLAVNVTPSLILMWTVLYGVLKELGLKKGDKFTALMIVGTFLGAISGQATLPFRGSTLAILGTFEAASGSAVPSIQYMILALIMSVVVICLYALFMKVVCKPADLAKVAHIHTDLFNKEHLPKMNDLQKANFTAMTLYVVLLLLPSVLPDSFFLTQMLNELGAIGITFLVGGAMVFVRIKGEPILDFSAVAAKSVYWDVVIMVAAAMAISSALTNEVTGVVDWMILTFEPILGGHSTLMFFVIMLLFGIIATTFASAMVLSISIMPVIVVFGLEASANLYAVTTLVVLLVHYSIILPSASVFAAMIWSNDEWIARKDVFKYGFVIVLVATVVAIALIPVANALF